MEIQTIRQFNRAYTKLFGLLDKQASEGIFSFIEARTIYAIGRHGELSMSDLASELEVDAGYLSRVIKKLEKENYIQKVQDKVDKRSYLVSLTESGGKEFTKLDDVSNKRATELVSHLDEQQLDKLQASYYTISNLLHLEETKPKLEDVTIRHTLVPGDIGTIIAMHGELYAKEYHYTVDFEAYVAAIFLPFVESQKTGKSQAWLAEYAGKIVGTIFVVDNVDHAQIRFFLLDPEFRGMGLGKVLLDDLIDYCKKEGFDRIKLETTSDLEQAMGMYESRGFEKVGDSPKEAWAKDLKQVYYELSLK